MPFLWVFLISVLFSLDVAILQRKRPLNDYYKNFREFFLNRVVFWQVFMEKFTHLLTFGSAGA